MHFLKFYNLNFLLNLHERMHAKEVIEPYLKGNLVFVYISLKLLLKLKIRMVLHYSSWC